MYVPLGRTAGTRDAWLLSPAAVIWAVVYYGLTFGSPASATIGMRIMDIEMRTWYGAPAYFVLGAAHAILYWVSVSFLTPFVLLVAVAGVLVHQVRQRQRRVPVALSAEQRRVARQALGLGDTP